MSHPAPSYTPAERKSPLPWRHQLEDGLTRTLLAVTRPLPYTWRIRFIGLIGAYVLGPLAGMRARIRANLSLVYPQMPESEVKRMCRKVPDNMARAFAELFSGQDFIDHTRNSPIEGEGLAALEAARDAGQPVMIVTAHFGNLHAARVVLKHRGFKIGGFFMPMRNEPFNNRYLEAMERIETPMFPRTRAGLMNLMQLLRNGGMVALLADHYMEHGKLMDFMGQPARTAISAAEMALKYNALLIPGYGIRQSDGVSFRIRIEAPIPHSDPMTMTRALNASLEEMVRSYPDQWMWSHRRWKKNRTR